MPSVSSSWRVPSSAGRDVRWLSKRKRSRRWVRSPSSAGRDESLLDDASRRVRLTRRQMAAGMEVRALCGT
jgi:hypothetical protein